jgi:hypothetical protein
MGRDPHPYHEVEAGEHASVFEEPATLREPAAPSVPRVVPLETLQEAREATDALLREILEEEPAGTSEPLSQAPQAAPALEEDWPAELHALPLLND